MRFLPLWLRRYLVSTRAVPALYCNATESPILLPMGVRGTYESVPPRGLIVGEAYGRMGLRELQRIARPSIKQLRDALDPFNEAEAYLREVAGEEPAESQVEGQTAAQWRERIATTSDAALLQLDYRVLLNVASLLRTPVRDARSKLSVVQAMRTGVPYTPPTISNPISVQAAVATRTPADSSELAPLNVTRTHEAPQS